MATTRRRAGTGTGSTPERILDAAERLVQERGFNGISYADVAALVGVTKANLHHHFGSKAELGDALLARYCGNFYRELGRIDASGATGAERLAGYAELYGSVARASRLCLCGVLAAEYETLPEPMRVGVQKFFADNEKWLTRTLKLGRADGSLAPGPDEREAARALLAGLEGALLVTRAQRSATAFRKVAWCLLGALGAAPRK